MIRLGQKILHPALELFCSFKIRNYLVFSIPGVKVGMRKKRAAEPLVKGFEKPVMGVRGTIEAPGKNSHQPVGGAN